MMEGSEQDMRGMDLDLSWWTFTSQDLSHNLDLFNSINPKLDSLTPWDSLSANGKVGIRQIPGIYPRIRFGSWQCTYLGLLGKDKIWYSFSIRGQISIRANAHPKNMYNIYPNVNLVTCFDLFFRSFMDFMDS